MPLHGLRHLGVTIAIAAWAASRCPRLPAAGTRPLRFAEHQPRHETWHQPLKFPGGNTLTNTRLGFEQSDLRPEKSRHRQAIVIPALGALVCLTLVGIVLVATLAIQLSSCVGDLPATLRRLGERLESLCEELKDGIRFFCPPSVQQRSSPARPLICSSAGGLA